LETNHRRLRGSFEQQTTKNRVQGAASSHEQTKSIERSQSRLSHLVLPPDLFRSRLLLRALAVLLRLSDTTEKEIRFQRQSTLMMEPAASEGSVAGGTQHRAQLIGSGWHEHEHGQGPQQTAEEVQPLGT
jgi:hypothetical protein